MVHIYFDFITLCGEYVTYQLSIMWYICISMHTNYGKVPCCYVLFDSVSHEACLIVQPLDH